MDADSDTDVDTDTDTDTDLDADSDNDSDADSDTDTDTDTDSDTDDDPGTSTDVDEISEDFSMIGTIILGAPTDTAVTASVVPVGDLELFLEWGTASGSYTAQTDTSEYPASEPVDIVIDGLSPNTRYYYRIQYRSPGASNFSAGFEHTFHTQRSPGSTFVFTVQSDSHLGFDDQCNDDLYTLTLQHALAAYPDFFLDLGDTFMSNKLLDKPDEPFDEQSVIDRHTLHRPYFGLIGHSAPLFLVIGNHEAEVGYYRNGTADSLPVWASNARTRYYPNPIPNSFYTGNVTAEEFVGLRENYYAWEWGDALFVALDAYWWIPEDPKETDDHWTWTLGEEQFMWFKETIERSDAKFKFVFAHHVMGEGRGAIEWATNFEWGGWSRNGKVWEFPERRPGWGDMAIHQLMADNGPTIFFQGHDHFFVKQELDGVVYQEVPMPADPTYSSCLEEGDCYGNGNDDIGYESGDILHASGHLRVTVSSSQVKVEYIRSFLPEDETQDEKDGDIAYTYTVEAD